MSKEQERAELHRVIWNIANDLRGSVDGWDFKTYVLGMLFYRFISEDLTRYLNKLVADTGTTDFDYASLSDEEALRAKDQTVQEKGYFILPSELFQNVAKRAKNDDALNMTLDQVFKNIEGSAKGTPSEPDLKGLFSDFDVNSNKLGGTVVQRNAKLTSIIERIADFKLGGELQEANTDIFGDAYEYLMTMYASNAGKSGGEFFTPQEVSKLLALIAIDGRETINRAYAPACGSGSLLLQFRKLMGDNVKNFYGQEINITTYNLCRINMFLHGVNFEKFDIALGDTLIDPQHWDYEPFDAIVSNPPYSTKWVGDGDATLINDPRFSPAGVLAPKSKADLAFTMHMLSWLSTTGTAAIVEFPGVLYRGGAEGKIRKYLIENNYVDTVIQLPDNLFFGVSIATCIIVLKKSKGDNCVLFVDASNEFVHEGNKNKLSEDNIKRIKESVFARKEEQHFTRLVKNTDIAEKDYNLSVSSYVEKEDTREVIDIVKLNAEIERIVAHENELRMAINKIINELR